MQQALLPSESIKHTSNKQKTIKSKDLEHTTTVSSRNKYKMS